MVLGFALIKTIPMKEHSAYNELMRVREVLEVHPLFGAYDLIVKIEADSFDNLGKILVEKIRVLDGIDDTKTLTGTKF